MLQQRDRLEEIAGRADLDDAEQSRTTAGPGDVGRNSPQPGLGGGVRARIGHGRGEPMTHGQGEVMEYDEFVEAFARRVAVPAPDADRLARAGLETLAERITGAAAEDLAAQLPQELTEPLLTHCGSAEGFDTDEFVRRVEERTAVDRGRAELTARALFATLSEAVSEGVLDDVFSQLPKEYGAMVPPVGWRSGPPPPRRAGV